MSGSTGRVELEVPLDVLASLVAEDDDILLTTDRERSVRYVSPSVQRVLGWEPAEFASRHRELLHPDDRTIVEAVAAVVRSTPGFHHAGEARYRSADRTWRAFELTSVNLLEAHGVVVTRMRDLAHRHQREQLVAAAAADELTGLARRGIARRELSRRLEPGHGVVGGRSVAVLFCDLDGFKKVNDTYGHGAGDQVLVEVAERLQRRLRATEFLARWGGDEFVAIVDVDGPTLAANLASRLRAAVLERPFIVHGEPVHLGLSIGVAVGAPGSDPERLLADADRAMYAAKRGSTASA